MKICSKPRGANCSKKPAFAPKKWMQLGGEIHLSNSVSDERGTLFLAMGLTQGEAAPEGTEKIATMRVPLERAVEMALAGEIKDALSVLALLQAKI